MTVELLIQLVVVGAIITSLLTQAIKVWCANAGKDCAPNFVALINAVVVGLIMGVIVFVFLALPVTIGNVLSVIALIFIIWIGSMIGFDKVVQSLKQLAELSAFGIDSSTK